MRIAICDDAPIEAERIAAMLKEYKKQKAADVSYQIFHSAVEMLSHIKNGGYGLLLLDIVMPGFTGMQAAHEVRTFDTDVKIAFLTSSPEFALEGYTVRARDYLLKPVVCERLFALLDSVFAEEAQPVEGLTLRVQKSFVHIAYKALTFVEVNQKRLYFYASDNFTQAVTAPLHEYEQKLLTRPEFVKVHRSYLVNLRYIDRLTQNGITMQSGQIVPVSRVLYSQVRKSYLDYLFAQEAGS